MSSDDIKNESPPPHYAEEVLCANWNPLALMLVERIAPVQPAMSAGLDVEAFLTRLYLSQQA